MEHHHSYHTRQTPRTKQDAESPTSPTHLNAFASSRSRSNRRAHPPSSLQDHQPMVRARTQAIRRNPSLWTMTKYWTRLPATSNRETSPRRDAGAVRERANVGACPNRRNLSLGTWSSPLCQKRRHLHPGSQWSHELNTVKIPCRTNMDGPMFWTATSGIRGKSRACVILNSKYYSVFCMSQLTPCERYSWGTR